MKLIPSRNRGKGRRRRTTSSDRVLGRDRLFWVP